MPSLDDAPTDWGELGSDRELARFEELKPVLESILADRSAGHLWPHTSVVIPSLSVDQAELTKVDGAAFYEERLLFSLIRLAHPSARMVYVTSQPLHVETLEYYLQHLPGIPIGRARSRLLVLCLHDASPKPLTAKILERPRVLDRIRRWIGPPAGAYLTVYNSTPMERRLAVELGIPLNSVDPSLLRLGSKSGGREVFEQAGVDHPPGTSDVRSEQDALNALDHLLREHPGLDRAVVKLNDSFAGEGNAVFAVPADLPPEGDAREAALAEGLRSLQLPGGRETPDAFFHKLATMGGIVEGWLAAPETRSPSVQMRIFPQGDVEVISTHDQVLGGSTGQVYLGCHFPASQDYHAMIVDDARKIAEELRHRGVVGRFGIDFLVTRSPGEPWRSHAIEINLRMGGTTPPYMALEFLTGGDFQPDLGVFQTGDGRERYYFATDNLKSPAYKGLLPEDLFDLLVDHGIQFRASTMTGVMFFMIGALSQFGKVGVTCIGRSRQEATELYESTVAILDHATGATGLHSGAPQSLFAQSPPSLD